LGRCWSNGCLGEGARSNSEVKETGTGNRRKFGAVQGRFFCPRALGGAGSCPCLCVACGFQRGRSIAPLSNSTAARNLRMGFLDSRRDERHAARQLAQGSCSPPTRSRAAGIAAPPSMRWLSVAALAPTPRMASSVFREKSNH
jgi:hypothetical protein